MKIRNLVAVLFFTAVITIVPVNTTPVFAADGLNVTHHSEQDIREYINNSGVSFSDRTEYRTEPVNPTVRGELTDNCKNSALKVLNNIRYIAGLDAVSLDSSQGDLAQAAAFVDYAINDLTHYPDEGHSKPEGMSDTDWNDGISGAGSANLAWNSGTMNRAVFHWTFDEDKNNIDRIGHRRWVLYPKMKTTGFGAAGAYYAMYSFDDRNTSAAQTNVAWPAENMPIEYFSAGLPWSVSTGSTVNKSNVRVTLTRLNDNKVWNFSGAETYAVIAEKYFNVNNEGYGQTGCIIFRPDGIDAYRDGDEFRVDITGAGSGISYTVKFFSMVPMTGIAFSADEISVPVEGTKTVSVNALPSNTSDTIDKSKLTYEIEDTDIAKVNANGVVTALAQGQTRITARYKDFTATADLYVYKSITDCSIQLESNYVTYTGSPVLPKFIVTDGDYTLVEGVDYDVVPYDDTETVNVSDSSYASVRGKGKYRGTRNNYNYYVVVAKPITSDMVTLTEESYVYDGEAHSPGAVLEYNGMLLEEGKDYTITKGSGTAAGSYKHTIKGTGNYNGTYNAAFSIDKLTLTEEMFSVNDSELIYNGEKQIPEVTMETGYPALTENKDYSVVYDNAVNAGEYSLTITGKGSCTGEVTLPFSISKAQSPQAIPEAAYTVPYMTKQTDNSILSGAEGWTFRAEDTGKDLAIGENYFTVKYTAADADNYVNVTKDITITRAECLHPEESVVIRGKVAPSCEEAGYTGDSYCTDCETVVITGNTVPATGHNWSDWEVSIDPTCLKAGEESRSCPVCGKEETRSVDRLQHSLSKKEAANAGCETAGNTECWTCSMCGKYFDSETGDNEISAESVVIPAIGHNWSDWEVSLEPTCLKEGKESRSCPVCGKKEDRPVAKLAHQLTTVEAVAPGCESAGNIRYYVCGSCGGSFSDENGQNKLSEKDIVLPATGHKWSEWVTTREASASADGERERHCTACEEVQTESVPYVAPEPEPDPESITGADGTPVGEGASIQAAEKAITAMKTDKDPAGTVFSKLSLRSTKQTKTSIKLKWTKVKGADKYYIYGNKCGASNHMVKQKAVSGTSLNVTNVTGNNNKTAKVKKGTYYKFIAVAVDKNGKVLSTSKVIHISTKGGKTGNFKSVTTKAKKNKVSIKKGKSFKLAAKGVPQSKKLKVKVHRKIMYETSNKKIATVSSKGVIKGKKKGSCYVYAYTQSGTFAKIKVTVK